MSLFFIFIICLSSYRRKDCLMPFLSFAFLLDTREGRRGREAGWEAVSFFFLFLPLPLSLSHLHQVVPLSCMASGASGWGRCISHVGGDTGALYRRRRGLIQLCVLSLAPFGRENGNFSSLKHLTLFLPSLPPHQALDNTDERLHQLTSS